VTKDTAPILLLWVGLFNIASLTGSIIFVNVMAIATTHPNLKQLNSGRVGIIIGKNHCHHHHCHHCHFQNVYKRNKKTAPIKLLNNSINIGQV
jgi:hypothetical protein